MQQRNAIRCQQRFQLCEEGVVMIDPDMLEHADRDDAVVLTRFLSVVSEVEPDPIGDPCGSNSPRCRVVLLEREGEARHIGPAFGSEIKRKSAPARPDIEHALTGADQQLCRDVLLFKKLGGIEILRAVAKIGARILAISVEEQLVELIRKIVMMSRIRLGPVTRIVLMKAAERSEQAV